MTLARSRPHRLVLLSLAALAALAGALPRALAAQAALIPAPAAVAQAAATITPEDVRRRIGVIAADSMRGRYTPSPELEETAAWIASEYRALGLVPAGDQGGFIQRFPIRTLALDPAASKLTFGAVELRFGRDVAPAFAYPLPGDLRRGPLWVVSGTGAGDPPPAALTGTHVLIVPPRRAEPNSSAVLALIRAVLAAEPAAIWVASDRDDADWAARGNVELRRRTTVPGVLQPLPVVLIRDRALEPILTGVGMDLATLRGRGSAAARWDDARRIDVVLEARVNVLMDASAPNVVAILPGSDPALRDQYVVFSAHMDHVGVGPAVNGDSIYNGADDDGSGTSTVVEIAQAFASLPVRPRRSLMFVNVSGEERGLWGSDWFTTHPPVPIDGLVADLNIDMVGRNWTDTIVAIGKEHSDLGTALAHVNAQHPELRMTAIDDLWPAESFYTRSDHYNFARRGVPILFFFNGTHEDYHRPSDEVEKIDAEKTARIGRLIFALGLELADRTERPQWNPASRARIVEGR